MGIQSSTYTCTVGSLHSALASEQEKIYWKEQAVYDRALGGQRTLELLGASQSGPEPVGLLKALSNVGLRPFLIQSLNFRGTGDMHQSTVTYRSLFPHFI